MKVILTGHDLGVMDEAVQALFAAGKNVQAIGLGAVTLRLRGQAEDTDELDMTNVVFLHEYSKRVDCA